MKTTHKRIVSKWIAAGYKKIPTIAYWNLNSSSNGVQAECEYEGVQLLQGRSSTMIKYILYGECAEEKTKVIDGVEVKVSSITPYETFRKAMDTDHYEALLNILRNSNEGELIEYR